MSDQAAQLRRLMLHAGRTPGPDDIPAPRTIVVSGGKEALGTTTVAVNLAIALAAHGLRVVLIDANLYRADVATHCGLRETPGIGEVLAGRKSIHEVLHRGPAGIQVVVGTRTAEVRNSCSERALQRMLRQVEGLGRHADFVLIDAGNGASEPTIRFWQAADEVLLVTSPDAVAVMDTYATVKTLLGRSTTRKPLRLVVNQAADVAQAADVHRRIDQSCLRFLGVSLGLAGWLPDTPKSPASSRQGQPMIVAQPESAWTAAVEQLADRLLSDPHFEKQHTRPQRMAA
jgi:flagellar biosynthesis protein FlhG